MTDTFTRPAGQPVEAIFTRKPLVPYNMVMNRETHLKYLKIPEEIIDHEIELKVLDLQGTTEEIEVIVKRDHSDYEMAVYEDLFVYAQRHMQKTGFETFPQIICALGTTFNESVVEEIPHWYITELILPCKYNYIIQQHCLWGQFEFKVRRILLRKKR